MSHAPVVLQFDRLLPDDPANGRFAAEQYYIVEKKTSQRVGVIRLRLSNQDEVLFYAGHVGYSIDAVFRGQHYAAYGCLELKPIAIERGFREAWITCDPDNWASRRTCERIGAELIEIVDLPEDLDMYLDGERQKCRYQWKLV